MDRITEVVNVDDPHYYTYDRYHLRPGRGEGREGERKRKCCQISQNVSHFRQLPSELVQFLLERCSFVFVAGEIVSYLPDLCQCPCAYHNTSGLPRGYIGTLEQARE